MSHFLNSPVFTGTPQAPTPLTADDSTKIATTAWVKLQGYGTSGGTVQSVAVTTANGVSATVSNATTTPNLTFTLGAITPTSVNGLTLTAVANGFTIAGGTASKTFTCSNTLTLSGNDGATLAIGAGGTLGSNAYNSTSYEPSANKSTATALGTSDTLFPTQNAVKTYVDNAVTGLLDDRGSYNASGNAWPSSGGSGAAGAIMKGDLWYISVAGTLGGTAVKIGDSIRALVDGPGTTASNWDILNVGLGFTPAAQNQTFYIGTSQVAINAGSGTFTTIAGMTSITSTTFVGALTGNASSATNIANGNANQIPYQTGAGATSFFSASNYGVQIYGATGVPASIAGAAGVLQGSASAIPAFTTTPTLTGTNFTGIPWGALPSTGSKPMAITTSAKTTAYTITNADDVVLGDATSGAFAITLPASPVNGEHYTIKKIDSSTNAITIGGNGKNIDGAANQTLPAQWNAFTVVYNGTAWFII